MGVGDDPPAAVTVVLVGCGLADALAACGIEVLARTRDLDDAARTVSVARPDVVVIDLDEAGPGAGAAISSITAQVPQAPLLAVSACAEHAAVLGAVRAGAAGYLVPTAGALELADAVRRTAAGDAVFSPGLAEVVLEGYGRRGGPLGDPSARLTEREVDVVRLVVEGLTGRQIATRLVLSQRTVENHVQNVLRKLGLANRAALVRYAVENGLA